MANKVREWPIDDKKGSVILDSWILESDCLSFVKWPALVSKSQVASHKRSRKGLFSSKCSTGLLLGVEPCPTTTAILQRLLSVD